MMQDTESVLDTIQPEEQAVETPQEQPQQPVETAADRNFKAMRERLDSLERKNREYENYISQLNKPQQQEQGYEPEESFSVDDDSYLDGKQFKKYATQLKKELHNTKKELEQIKQSTFSSTAEIRLKSKYSDFDSVVTRENIEKLAMLKPSAYRSITYNPDVYDKGELAYEMIKSMGITQGYQQEDQKIAQNRNKPRSTSMAAPTPSPSPLANVDQYDRRTLSKEQQERIRRFNEQAKMGLV